MGLFDVPRKRGRPKKDPLAAALGLEPEKRKVERDVRRTFTQTQKNELWVQQNGRCASTDCNHSQLDPRTTEYDHIKPWSDNGKTVLVNGAALCANCHKLKTHKDRVTKIDKKRKPKKKSDNPFEIFNPSKKGKKDSWGF
jgi:hypothetical protein